MPRYEQKSTDREIETVVVTGASAGLDRAVAREFGRHGARVGLLARGIDGLQAAKREIEALGGSAIVMPTDVADPEAVEYSAAAVEERYLDQQCDDVGVFSGQRNEAGRI